MATRALFRRTWLCPARLPFPRAAYTTKSTPSPLTATAIKETAAKPKGGKLKELAQKYGAAGVIVYLGVGVIDLGVAFGAIQIVGQDKVMQLEHGVMVAVANLKARCLGQPLVDQAEPAQSKPASIVQTEKPSFTSICLLAYGIHKTLFLPIRLTVTAAITPAVVRKLHALGWTRFAPRWFGIR